MLFLLTEAQIFDEGFLVPLNEWLSTGHPPPSFFAIEERDTVVHNIRNRTKLVLKVRSSSVMLQVAVLCVVCVVVVVDVGVAVVVVVVVVVVIRLRVAA